MRIYHTIGVLILCVFISAFFIHDVSSAESEQIKEELFDETCKQAVGEDKGYTFELLACERAGNTVTCHLKITSHGQNRELIVRGWKETRIIDEFGQEHETSRIESGIYHDSRKLKRMFFADKPAEVSISFGEISPKVGTIAQLELHFIDVKAKDINFTVPNISFCSRKEKGTN